MYSIVRYLLHIPSYVRSLQLLVYLSSHSYVYVASLQVPLLTNLAIIQWLKRSPEACGRGTRTI